MRSSFPAVVSWTRYTTLLHNLKNQWNQPHGEWNPDQELSGSPGVNRRPGHEDFIAPIPPVATP